MKKFLLILLTAGVVYGVAWVALAQLGEQQISKAIKTASVTMTGFPQRFTAKLDKPEIAVGNTRITSEEVLVVSRNLAGSEYHFLLPHTLAVHTNNAVLNCSFPKQADLLIKVEPLTLEKQNYQTLQTLLQDPKFYQALRSMDYKDEGGTCINLQNKSRFAYTNSVLNIRNERRGSRGVLYYKGAMAGDMNVAFDAELEGYDPFLVNAFPDNAALRINTLHFQNARYAGDVSGYVKMSQSDIFPYGLVKLGAQHVDALLDDVYAAPMQKLPDRIKFKNFLTKIAGADAGADNLAISVSRQSGGDLKVGTMTLAQFLTGWKALFADNHNGGAQ